MGVELAILGLVALVAWLIYSVSIKGYLAARSAPSEMREASQKKWKQLHLAAGLSIVALASVNIFRTDLPKGGGIIWYDLGGIGVGLALVALSIFAFPKQP
jgi:hypothetical protein